MKSIILFYGLIFLVPLQVLAQKQGIKGEVFWLGGDQMPGVGKSSTPKQGVVREVFIYDATNLNDARQQGIFFDDIKTALVAKVLTHVDGSFKVKLPAGKYSVFVKETSGLFANQFDTQGCINCIIVRRHAYAWMTILIDYEAAY